jgi:hypothetical protein
MPEGYRYSRFCELYRGWAAQLSVTMRQAHIGGDKLSVDYAGETVPVIVDQLTGRTRLVFFDNMMSKKPFGPEHVMASGGVVRLTYRDRRSPKQDARSHCRHRIPPFARRFGSEDPQR